MIFLERLFYDRNQVDHKIEWELGGSRVSKYSFLGSKTITFMLINIFFKILIFLRYTFLMNIYNNVEGYIMPLLEPWLTFFRTTFVLFLRERISHLDIKWRVPIYSLKCVC